MKNDGRGRARARIARRASSKWIKLAVLLAAWALCFLMLSTNITPLAVKLELGKPAMRNVIAHRTVLNKAATDILKQEARKNFLLSSSENPAYMRINETVSVVAESRMDTLFSLISKARGNTSKGIQARLDELVKAMTAAGIPSMPKPALSRLIELTSEQFSEELSIVKRYVVSVLKNKKVLESTLAQEKKLTYQGLTQLGLDPEIAKSAADIANTLIEPNTAVDMAALEKSANEAEANVQSVYIQKGTVIVKQGQIVTEQHLNLTKSLGLLKGMEPVWARLSLGLLAAMVLGTFAVFMSWTKNEGYRNDKKFLLSVVLITVGVFMSWAAYRFLGDYAPLYVPVAYIAMSLTLMVDSRTAMAAGVTTTVFNCFMFQGSLMSMIGPLTGVVLGINMARDLTDRFSMVRAALYIAAGTAVTGASVSALAGDLPTAGILVASATNGLLSAVLCLGTMPFAEAAMGLSSPFRLLEVSNPGNELLRRIMMEAPGTYHHSIIVGNLAEAAASTVGADPLLVRAAALYHDCGKVKQPDFFVENQINKVNPHDDLPPEVSSGIIIDHVAYGIQLARENGLPASIIDIIAQHHGCSKVWYFYHKAMGRYGSVEDAEKYSYPGPSPQTSEAALIMLADITEAKIRTVNTADPEKVRESIHSLIRERLYAGDLNETPLTLKDLKEIEESFVNTISGVKHERIAYPSQSAQLLKDGTDGKDARGNE
ncbi:MAG TPA: HDIG domain-containing protein [Bacillota bacterium]|nr:HDIG domain-containing protein [Bacillota bacterium]HOH10676.1 HDIG domain-containing protein [Bacillota bacterium]HPI01320.1 HDIG domain-containing protein [Bacillota bacterium]HPM63719.1 HDIG domain-containing protein [Bacillota bacterium]